MPSARCLRLPFLLSVCALVTHHAAAAQQKKTPVDIPKIVNWCLQSRCSAHDSGVLDTKHSGRLRTRFPGERNKTSVILLRSSRLFI